MRMASLIAWSPAGVKIEVKASEEGTLHLYRTENFLDVRDTGLDKHEDGNERLVAQIPADWSIIPSWQRSAVVQALPGVLEAIRHSGAVIPCDDCACNECNNARARKRTENSGKSGLRAIDGALDASLAGGPSG